MRRPAAAVVVLLLLCVVAAVGAQENPQRFPRPEFETDYEQPVTTTPAARGGAWEVVDVALLALALAVAAHLALKRRSRNGLVVLSILCLAYFGFYREGCICPIGALQNVTVGLVDGGYLVPLSVIAFFLLPLGFALFYGRVFCSSVCPFGALQELVILRPIEVPARLAEVLGFIRHVYLGLGVLFAATGSVFLICSYDPFVAFFRLSGSFNMLLFGAGFLLLSTVVARPYCRFLCPYGVLLGWLSRLSPRRVQTYPDECIDCRLCEAGCPVGAIHQPTPQGSGPAEETATGVRRLIVLLVLLPVVTVAAGWVGSELDVVLSRMHPTVRLAERILVENAGTIEDTTLESRTFRSTGTTTAELMRHAQAIRSSFNTGGWLLGAFLGLTVMIRLLALSLRRTRTSCETDAGGCVACGRCFAYCPREQVQQQGDSRVNLS